MINKIKAIIFDQDNTIFNTSQIAHGAYRKGLTYISDSTGFPKDSLEGKWSQIVSRLKIENDPVKRTFAFSLGVLLKEENLGVVNIDKVIRIFRSELNRTIELTSGTKEFFDQKIKLIKVLVTEDNREYANMKLRKFNLRKSFSLLVTSDETNIMKPSIKYYDIVWKKYKLNPDECAYIGDNWPKDCQIGQRLGGIGVVFGSEDERANYSIYNMMELINILNITL